MPRNQKAVLATRTSQKTFGSALLDAFLDAVSSNAAYDGRSTDPTVNRERFTMQERERLEELLLIYGTKWTKIAKFFPGRTDHQVKNAMARFANHVGF